MVDSSVRKAPQPPRLVESAHPGGIPNLPPYAGCGTEAHGLQYAEGVPTQRAFVPRLFGRAGGGRGNPAPRWLLPIPDPYRMPGLPEHSVGAGGVSKRRDCCAFPAPPPAILDQVAAIQITRRLQYQQLFGRWFAYLDDVPVAKLPRGKALLIEATPGPHSLMIGSKNRRSRSNTLHVDLNSADVRFKCEVNPGLSRMMFSNGPMQNFRLAKSAARNELAAIDLSSLDRLTLPPCAGTVPPSGTFGQPKSLLSLLELAPFTNEREVLHDQHEHSATGDHS